MTSTVPVWFALMLGLMPLRAPAPAPARVKLPERAVELRNALGIGVSFPEIDAPLPLTAVLDELARKFHKSNCTRLPFTFNEKAFRDEEITKPGQLTVDRTDIVPPMRASLGTVLRKILSQLPVPSKATYIIRKDHIEITTTAALVREFFPRRPEETYCPLVIASFDHCPLDQALREIAELTSTNVVLDVRAAKAGKKTITAGFMNVPFDRAVSLLLRRANLEPVYTGRVLYVTTRENARALRAKLGPRRVRPQPRFTGLRIDRLPDAGSRKK
jgi:hypothetical protein